MRRKCMCLISSDAKFCVLIGKATPRPIPGVSTGNATCRRGRKSVFLLPEERVLLARTTCCSDACHALHESVRNYVSGFIGDFIMRNVQFLMSFWAERRIYIAANSSFVSLRMTGCSGFPPPSSSPRPKEGRCWDRSSRMCCSEQEICADSFLFPWKSCIFVAR